MADVTNEASFSSADDAVATVDDTGTVTAVGAGETEITVFYETETTSVAVTVVEEEDGGGEQ